ncbi:MAG: RNA polymerase sigma factor [Candidatus Cyclobacteriaceae bacterium M2_1C_046]
MEKKYKYFSDNELAVLLKDNYDPAVFNELVNRYNSKIKKQCQLLVKNEDNAEDLAQEILIKLFMKIKSFKAESEFSTWIFSITHHTCIDFLRKNKKVLYQKFTEELAESLGEDISENGEELLDFSVEKFEKLLDELDPETRSILILKYKQNLPIKDIQEQMNLGESAIKMRLKRAREKMKKLLVRKEGRN